MLEMSEQHPADCNHTFAQSCHNEELFRGTGRSHLTDRYYLSIYIQT